MTRLSARSIEATVVEENDSHVALCAPAPGLFLARVAVGELVTPGTALGELDVLGRRTILVAPETMGIVVVADTQPVAFGDPVVRIDTSAHHALDITSSPAKAKRATDAAASGLVFRAPMSGRFYTRSAPDKPPFVEVGSELSTGTTVCLLEVMKTFNRVTYGGAGLPPTAKVTAVLVADGADVTAGEPLFSLA